MYLFRQAGPAAIGTLLFGVVIAITFVNGWKSNSKIFYDFNSGYFSEIVAIRTGIQILTFLLMWIGFFQIFGPLWIVGYQLAIFSLFGFYAAWLMDKEYTFMYFLLSIYNWLCVAGRLPLFGFRTALADMTTSDCNNYFFPMNNPSRCETGGYLNFLRLLGLAAIFFSSSCNILCLSNLEIDGYIL